MSIVVFNIQCRLMHRLAVLGPFWRRPIAAHALRRSAPPARAPRATQKVPCRLAAARSTTTSTNTTTATSTTITSAASRRSRNPTW
eukprot:5490599-Heterocapsa_arctica.AAC.1